MLKEKKNYTVTAYEAGSTTRFGRKHKWIVEITEEPDMFHAYLYLTCCGVKELMFGSPKWQEYRQETVTREHFMELVEANLPDYKRTYMMELDD